jgi:hypothetical protein
MFSTLYLVVALVCATPADAKPMPADEKQAAACAACAKTCTDCQTACDSCYRHCAWKVFAGNKDHHTAMEMCLGCADSCRFASTLVARHSPMACHAGECCMKCCDDAATACEKFPDDKTMAECAKSCRECAKMCKTMATK